jgi:hypothetical protein
MRRGSLFFAVVDSFAEHGVPLRLADIMSGSEA